MENNGHFIEIESGNKKRLRQNTKLILFAERTSNLTVLSNYKSSNQGFENVKRKEERLLKEKTSALRYDSSNEWACTTRRRPNRNILTTEKEEHFLLNKILFMWLMKVYDLRQIIYVKYFFFLSFVSQSLVLFYLNILITLQLLHFIFSMCCVPPPFLFISCIFILHTAMNWTDVS